MKINFRTPIVNNDDSYFKKFFKEFFSFNGLRYTPIKIQNDPDSIQVETRPKTGVWKENIFKVALCFTVFVPIIAAISKFIELHNLKTKTFTIIKPNFNGPEAPNSPLTTAEKVDILAPKPQRPNFETMPGTQRNEVQDYLPKPSTGELNPKAKVRAYEIPITNLSSINPADLEVAKDIFNSLYEIEENRAQLDSFKQSVKETRLIVRMSLSKKNHHEYSWKVDGEGSYYYTQMEGGWGLRREHYLEISKDIVDRFNKDKTGNKSKADLSYLLQQITQANNALNPPKIETPKTPSQSSFGSSPTEGPKAPALAKPSRTFEIPMSTSFGVNEADLEIAKDIFDSLYKTNLWELNTFKKHVEDKHVEIRLSRPQNQDVYFKSDFSDEKSYIELNGKLLDRYKSDKNLCNSILIRQIENANAAIAERLNRPKKEIRPSLAGPRPPEVAKNSALAKPIPRTFEILISKSQDVSALELEIARDIFNSLHATETNRSQLNTFKRLVEQNRVQVKLLKPEQTNKDFHDEEIHKKGSYFYTEIIRDNWSLETRHYLAMSKNLLDRFAKDKTDQESKRELTYLLKQITKANKAIEPPKEELFISPFSTSTEEEEARPVTKSTPPAEQEKKVSLADFNNLKSKKGISKFTFDEICLYSELMQRADWREVSDKQIESFDFAQLKLAQLKDVTLNEIVGILFSTDTFENASKRVPLLSFPQILALSTTFTRSQWRYVSETQIPSFDFAQLKLPKEIVVEILFATERSENASKRVPLLSFPQILALSTTFTRSQWRYVSETQIPSFDFAQLKLAQLKDVTLKEIVEILFSTDTFENASKRVPLLSFPQILALSTTFTRSQWRYVSDKQIPSFNFAQLKLAQLKDVTLKEIVEILFSTDTFENASKRVPLLSFPQILALSTTFTRSQWRYVSETQIPSFDFAQLKLAQLKDVTLKEIVEILFSTDTFKNAAKRVPLLSFPQICALAPAFKLGQWLHISEEQLEKFNLEDLKLETKDAKHILENAIFPTNSREKRLAKLPAGERVKVEKILYPWKA